MFLEIAVRTILNETNSPARKRDFTSKIQKVLRFENRLCEIKYGSLGEVNFAWMMDDRGLNTPFSQEPVQIEQKKQVVSRMDKVRQQAWDWEFARL